MRACVLVLLAACSSRSSEGKAQVGPIKACQVPEPLRKLSARDIPLEGYWEWTWMPGYDFTALSVRRIEEERFELDLHRWTDFGHVEDGLVTARWSGAGLVLDSSNRWFPTVLYPARFEGEECLVPIEGLERLHTGNPLWSNPSPQEEQQYAFRRVPDGSMEKVRATQAALDELQAVDTGQ
jgi:hypothetical protein